MDMVRDLTSILKNGGTRAAYRRVAVDSNGTITAAEANWHDLVYRTKSTPNFNQMEDPVYGEGGEVQAYEEGNTDFTYVITSSQVDAALINFIMDEAGTGKYFQFFVDWGKGRSSKKLEAYIPLLQFRKAWTFNLPERRMDITLTVLRNETLNVPSNLPSWAAGTAANFSTAAGRYFSIYET